MKAEIQGHLLAIFTIVCWGTTFISTKILLQDFTPIEIMMTRFAIGLMVLYILRPDPIKFRHEEHRLYLVVAALCGVTLYYLMENIALTYTYASNVGIIISTSPLFAVILARFTLKNQQLTSPFFIGFVLAIAGIACISFESYSLNFNPRGDILALGAAVLWAVYAVIIRKICVFRYDMIAITREIFLYGMILMVPVFFFTGFRMDLVYLLNPINLANMLYLGVCASALCFLSWNFATKYLGVLKITVYIYATPVVTLITAFLILGEPITLLKLAGIILTIGGLIVSQR